MTNQLDRNITARKALKAINRKEDLEDRHGLTLNNVEHWTMNFVIHLVPVCGLFASFKYQVDSHYPRQTAPVFRICRPFSWQAVDLFLGLFSGFGCCLLWEIDNVDEFVQICHYFMVNERFLDDIFRASFRPNYCH